MVQNPRILVISFFLAIIFATAVAADIPGAKDPAGIKRYEGSTIIRFEDLAYEQYVLPLGKMTKFDFSSKEGEYEKSETLEGKLTRVSYRVPDTQRSSLEVFRNYQNALTEAGFEILWQASGKAQLGNAFTSRYQTLRDNDQLFSYSDAQTHFLTARKASEGLYAALFVTKYDYGLKRGVVVEKGDPLIQLDVVQTKKMEEKMVLVSASEMAKAIDQKGSVSLYGIYFDFNSAALKPESDAALSEIAKLLTEKPELKLLVVGHTDNIGSFDANRDLSSRRAASVITELSAKYSVNESRLTAFGASFAAPVASNSSEEGRAKNRRVELVEINSAHNSAQR
jgi:OOP family OmpA-OmpF porin